MAKKIVSEKNVISVYQFMDMCGLKCPYKDNIKVSHTIMMKKLELRNKAFPGQVMVPSKVYVPLLKEDEILTGEVVAVEDDYKKIIAYHNPLRFNKRIILSSLKKHEPSFEEDEKEIDESTYKPGYIKYLNKKNKRQQLEKIEYLKKAKEDSKEEDNYMDQVSSQKRLSLYCRRGFGRR